MEPFLTAESGVELTRDEAAGLASIRDLLAWGPLLRILQAMRSDSVDAVMRRDAPPDVAAFNRGRYEALSDVEGMLAKVLPEAYLAKLSIESGKVSATETDPDGR